MSAAPFTLISHPLCPYVQRAAIVLAEKGLTFQRIDIDLARKPDWFTRLSPLGKTPALLMGDEVASARPEQALFESAVICEFLDDIALPRLHPHDAWQRARHRSWMEFGSQVLNGIGAFYNAPDEASLQARAADLHQRFVQLEAALGEGPFFAGDSFSVVDAVFAPVFRYFEVFDTIADFGCFTDCPRVQAWRQTLAQRPSVQAAVGSDYAERLRAFLQARGSALTRRMQA